MSSAANCKANLKKWAKKQLHWSRTIRPPTAVTNGFQIDHLRNICSGRPRPDLIARGVTARFYRKILVAFLLDLHADYAGGEFPAQREPRPMQTAYDSRSSGTTFNINLVYSCPAEHILNQSSRIKAQILRQSAIWDNRLPYSHHYLSVSLKSAYCIVSPPLQELIRVVSRLKKFRRHFANADTATEGLFNGFMTIVRAAGTDK